ncbi:hypothetical protein TL16_g06770 [Triparma laevis f. inornata]|uniref:TFIIS central domain-containing protein n=1 Tax=Triparma laevis f. inornata TaxID=1714386 RepID=A0A9W7EE24_9STRA|nr:hypothetical protein TL16_g06770 [Triparma laevis f. inornata]
MSCDPMASTLFIKRDKYFLVDHGQDGLRGELREFALDAGVDLEPALGRLVAAMSLIELKSQLVQSRDSASKYAPPLEVLKKLDGIPPSGITLATLAESQIGKVVTSFKSEDTVTKWGQETADLAKSIVKKWKKVAKSQGASAAPSDPKKSVAAVASTSKPTSPLDVGKSEAQKYADALDPPTRGKVLMVLRQGMLEGCQFEKSKGKLLEGKTNEDCASLAFSAAKSTENAIRNKYGSSVSKDYQKKAMTLKFNLKKNTYLAGQMLLRLLEPETLVDLSTEQLATREAVEAAEGEGFGVGRRAILGR